MYESLANSGKFLQLDVALSTEILRIAKGELGRTITRKVDTDAQKGSVTRGRQLLWLIYDYHRVSEEAGALYDISDLLKVEWLSDAKIETFISNWENVLSGCIQEVDESTKKALFLQQVRKKSETKSRCGMLRSSARRTRR